MSDLLFLAHRVPYPPDRGDKIRSCNVIRYLAERARVHLVAFAEDPADCEPPPAFRDLFASRAIIPRTKSRARSAAEALVTGRPVSLTAFAHPTMTRAVGEVLATRPIDAIYCFSGQMAQHLPPRLPRAVMDFVDVDSAKFAGLADGSSLPVSWMMRREARLLGAFERAVAARVDASLFVSEAEAALFDATDAHVRVVGNGIDIAFFDPDAAFRRVAEPGPLIVFTGQMDYQPNVDAVRWFARDILPCVRARHPTTRFAVVGRAPIAAVRALAGDGVIVTGGVDDVRGWLAAAAVCVAPLQLARGVQNKVLEAMAMARPVVASMPAAEGIDHGGTIAVAEDGPRMADRVIALLDDPAVAAAMGEAARSQVVDLYGWTSRLAPLDALLDLTPHPALAT